MKIGTLKHKKTLVTSHYWCATPQVTQVLKFAALIKIYIKKLFGRLYNSIKFTDHKGKKTYLNAF